MKTQDKNELIAFSQLFTSNASDNSSSEVGDSKWLVKLLMNKLKNY